MPNPNEPIIQSLLDMDFYKFTMGQFVFLRYPKVPVKCAFKNRTKDRPLGKLIKEEDLRRELDHVRALKFNRSEMKYLRGTIEHTDKSVREMFGEEYLYFLQELQLPPYNLKYEGDSFTLEFEGDWCRVIYWETLALSIINELYYRSLMEKMSRFERDLVYAKGKLLLAEKIAILKANPDIIFTDFGTRRRFSRDWQDYVISVLAEAFPETQFRGTSNVWLAMKHGLMPMGTSAHELFMILAGVKDTNDEEIRGSHNEVLKMWWQLYGYGLSVALTDTFGSDFFFRDMRERQAQDWKGLRQDSGNPISFGEKAIEFYKRLGVDPKEKMIIFSDGLELPRILEIHNHFRGRIKDSYGWGTNLTNDLGFRTLSLVVKPVEACGKGLVKLSDNPAKAVGRPEDIERYKRIFNYEDPNYVECKY